MDRTTLEAAFRQGMGALWGKGRIEDLYAFLDEGALVIDEDTPFLLDKAQFREHLEWHLGGLWSAIEWIPREPRFDTFGTTGLVSAYFTLRGKPKDSGFRLRHGLVSLVCHWDGAAWRALSLNLDPLSGHIVDASPG